MKKLIILSLALLGSLFCTNASRAAVHNFTSGFDSHLLLHDYNYYNPLLGGNLNLSFEGWYYITWEQPGVSVRIAANGKRYFSEAEYFQNDQTFLTYYHSTYGDQTKLYLKGSYLLADQYFIGVDTVKGDDDFQLSLAPGYRYNLPKNSGFIAASADLAVNDDCYDNAGIIDLEVYGRYYIDKGRFYGELLIPNRDVVGNDFCLLYGGGAYQISPNIIVGANLYQLFGSQTILEVGCTTNFKQLGVEFRYTNFRYDESSDNNDSGSDNNYFGIDLNLLYSLGNRWRTGMEIIKYSDMDDPALLLKGKYQINNQHSVIFGQGLQNDTYDSITYLYWDWNWNQKKKSNSPMKSISK
jgi:hypothetical protein